MGFFDSIFKQSAKPAEPLTFVNECSALVAILYSAINADGNIDELEIDALAKAIVLKQAFKGYNPVTYYENAAKLSNKHGGAAVIKAASDSLSPESRKAAFVLTIDLLFANGNVNADERQFVDDLMTVMQLDQNWAKAAIEVIYMKYS